MRDGFVDHGPKFGMLVDRCYESIAVRSVVTGLAPRGKAMMSLSRGGGQRGEARSANEGR